MRRTFNYTGRKKIPQKLVRIVLSPAAPKTIEVNWSLESLNLPDEGCVFVEAGSSGSPSVTRFAWGTVAAPKPPSDRIVDGAAGDNLTFSLKVVDEVENKGRLLGIANHIRPVSPDDTDGGGRMSILPVNAVDLGQEVWNIKFEHDRPWLEVNNRIDGIKEIARSDGTFFSLVYPAAIRRILTQILVFENYYDPVESLVLLS